MYWLNEVCPLYHLPPPHTPPVRYRLLIRRAMEGDRRLGMACMKPDRSSLDPLATEAEILECTAQPDG
jgi:Lon protease-like protein